MLLSRLWRKSTIDRIVVYAYCDRTVPQGRRLFGSMTVRENLELGAYTKNQPADIAKKIKLWSDFFPEIGERLHVRASLLSGG